MVSEHPKTPAGDDLQPQTPLPRGRHGLSPEAVERHQRERVAAAVAGVIAERGYGGLTVEHIRAGAGISRSTFYVHFADKQEALLASHELIFNRFLVLLGKACEKPGRWPEKVDAGIAATLEFAAEEPAQAQLLASELLATDLEYARRVCAAHDRLAALLAGGRRYYPAAASLPAVTERALVGALATILARHLLGDDPQPSASLRRELTELVLIPYLGPSEAALASGHSVGKSA